MFPEDVNLNIIAFLGPSPRKRCWSRNKHKRRCKKNVTNTSRCIFCPIHEHARFSRPLFKPYEDLVYIIEQIGKHKQPKTPCIEPITVWMGYPNFPYV